MRMRFRRLRLARRYVLPESPPDPRHVRTLPRVLQAAAQWKRLVKTFTMRFRGNQRKGRFVKLARGRDFGGAGPEVLAAWCVVSQVAWGRAVGGCRAAGMLAGALAIGQGAKGAGCARTRPRGSCARRSSSGLGVPTAFNRAG